MGDVINGKYPVSLSAWNWLFERDSFVDFVPIFKDRQVMALVPSLPDVDPGLFTRLRKKDGCYSTFYIKLGSTRCLGTS